MGDFDLQKSVFIKSWVFVIIAAIQIVGVLAIWQGFFLIPFIAAWVIISMAIILDWKALSTLKPSRVSIEEKESEFQLGQSYELELQLELNKNFSVEAKIYNWESDFLNFENISKNFKKSKSGVYRSKIKLEAFKLGKEKKPLLRFKIHSLLSLVECHWKVTFRNWSKNISVSRTEISEERFRAILSRQSFLNFGSRFRSINQMPELVRSVRAYQSGDLKKFIDPKKSAKFGELMTREYEVLQSLNLLCVVDAGRHSMGMVGENSKLSHYLSSAHSLMKLAVDSSDTINFFTIGHRIENQLINIKSAGDLAQLSYLENFTAKPVESNYFLIPNEIKKCAPKRSLVIFFADFSRKSTQVSIQKLLPLIVPKHFLLLVSLDEKENSLNHLVGNFNPQQELDLSKMLSSYQRQEQFVEFEKRMITQKVAFLNLDETILFNALQRFYSHLKNSLFV